MNSCGICGQPREEKLENIYGIAMCGPCAGNPLESLERAGLKPETKRHIHQVFVGVPMGESHIVEYHTEVTWRLARPLPLQVSFTREGIRHKLIKIFRKELQTGDQDFDRTVYISTETPDEAGKFLSTEGVRGVIMALVKGGTAVSIEDDSVTFYHETNDARSDGPNMKEMCAVICHLTGMLRVASSPSV